MRSMVEGYSGKWPQNELIPYHARCLSRLAIVKDRPP